MKKSDKTHSYDHYSLKDVLTLLVNRLGISDRYVKFIFEEYMVTHPSYPSFAALSYTLTRSGIENVGAMVDFDTLRQDIDFPVVAHLSSNNGAFALIEGIDKDYVKIITHNKIQQISIPEFKALFSGNILIFDREVETIHVTREQKWEYWFIPLLRKCIPVFALLLFLLFYRPTTTFSYLYTLCFVIGLGFSLLLFAKQMGFSDKLTDQICSGGKNSSIQCNSVLASKGAKLFSTVGWSEIGVIYFLTLLISSLLFTYESLLPLLVMISFCSITYIFYSIYYQWRIVKAWCPLCLGVQAIFITQFVFSLLTLHNVRWAAIEPYTFVGFILLGLLISAILFTLKPLIESPRKAKIAINRLQKLKFNAQVKEILFSEDEVSMSEIQKIAFFPDAANQISFVFSPTCSPCIAKIELLLSYLENYEDVGVEFIIFQKDPSSEKERAVIYYLMESYCSSPDNFIAVLRTYANEFPQNLKKWETYTLLPDRKEAVERIYISHQRWCMQSEITGTPTIYFNYKKLPDSYTLQDISYLLI